MIEEEKLIKHLAFVMVLMMLLVLGLAFFIKPKEGLAPWTDNRQDAVSLEQEGYLLQNGEKAEEVLKYNEIGSRFLRIRKEKQDSLVQVSLQDLYRKKSLQIIFHGLQSKDFSESSISWTEDGKTFLTNEMQKEKTEGEKSLVFDVNLTYNKKKFDSDMQATFTLRLDRIYAQTLYEDDSYIYVALNDPHEVYNQILVLDAGHGGEDTGSYSEGKKYDEKDLNLQILLKLKNLLEKESIQVYYTRLKDEEVALAERVQLANDINADFFISLHCNFSNNNQIHGTEVIYSDKKNQTGFPSEHLAEILLEGLVQEIDTRKRSVVDDDSILILNRSKVPVSIVEIGYISNQDDLKLLLEEKNQMRIAEGIRNGIMKAYDKKEKGDN